MADADVTSIEGGRLNQNAVEERETRGRRDEPRKRKRKGHGGEVGRLGTVRALRVATMDALHYPLETTLFLNS